MSDGGSTPKLSLRERAEAIKHRPGYKSRVDTLLDRLPVEDRDEVLDLLKGEPLVSHAAVTEVLREEWPELCESLEINDRNVLDWRHARGIKLRPSQRG